MLRPTAFVFLASATLLGCLEESVRFGPVGGLRVRGTGDDVGGASACSLAPGTDTTICPEWATAVFPLFDKGGALRCGNSGCHEGPNDPTGVNMVAGDPAASYAALAAYQRDGRPYIKPNGADEAYLMCNVWRSAPVTIGVVMPLAGTTADEHLKIIGSWVSCGMLPEGGIPGTGGGGAAGGAGGAGGG
jgi:hypothetical protein